VSEPDFTVTLVLAFVLWALLTYLAESGARYE
jgi:hypothetical protein